MGVNYFMLFLQIEGIFWVFSIGKTISTILFIEVFAVVSDNVGGIGILNEPINDSFVPTL